ncbi:MAG: permease [Pelagibacteraceae bacterium]|nr:permease [Pelagibacteraceae bacterium]
MKKLIFKKFAKDVFQFFLLVSISISLIVWVIQAVNFLDIVAEDGHGFKVYFLYTLLSLPKIFSKILPFIYFISLFYIILKYENENELIIFWTIGIKKIEFVNVLLKFSIFYLILQLLLTTYVVPTTLDKARSYIRGSNVDLFSSIIQEKKFIDVVKNLTIFVEEKDNKGNLKNIFLKEKIEKNKSQTIFAKEGKIQKYDNKSTLLLFDGKIINNNNKKVNSFEFSKTEINLSKFTTKTTTHPKIQEIGTYNVLNCVIRLKNINNAYIFNVLITKKKLNNCIPENLKNSFQEIFKRLISPFYLLPLCLIACLIIIKSKDDYEYFKYKFGLFILGVITIIISEISIKYTSTKIIQNIHIFTLPILFLIVIYLYIKFKLKKPNLINQ